MKVLFSGYTSSSDLMLYKEEGKIGYFLQTSYDSMSSGMGDVSLKKFRTIYDFLSGYLLSNLHLVIPMSIDPDRYDFFHEQLNKLLLKMDSTPELVNNEIAFQKRERALDNRCPKEAWEIILHKSVWSDKAFSFYTKEEIEEQRIEALPPKPDIISEYMAIVRAKTERERAAYLQAKKRGE